MRLHALFRLAFALAPAVTALALPHPLTRWLILQKARHHPLARTLTGCRRTVSGSISLPSPGFFSPFPHGTCSLSVSQEYLALEDGPPVFSQDTTCPDLLDVCVLRFRVRGYHPVSPSFPACSTTTTHIGSSPFARRYWGNL